MRLIPDIGNLAHIDQFFVDVSQALDEGGQALVELLTPTRTEPETAGPDPLPAAGVVASEPMPTAVPVTTGTPDPDVPVSAAQVVETEEPDTGPRQQPDPIPPVQEPVRAATPEAASPDLPVLDTVESSSPADLDELSAPDDAADGPTETRTSRRGVSESGTGLAPRRGVSRSAASSR
jgi:outer membrane biosynthesis protein TonB